MSLQTLLTKTGEYLPPDKLELIRQSYDFAERAHDGQLRASGEPFLEHPLNTALLLADLQLDSATVAAALLHDVIEDCGVSKDAISKLFGAEIAKLVDGVTKLNAIELKTAQGKLASTSGEQAREQAENLRKMLIAMAEDIRVVLIKLSDRLHNMRTLDALPEDRRRRIALETMDIYAPLASRLGIWQVKWQLEDLSFRHLEPQKYQEVAQLLASKREQREEYVQEVTVLLQQELEKAGVKAEVSGRPKHIYSIYRKMEKYASQGKEFNQIYDLFALRVLVDEIQDCYHALGVVHSLWRPIPGQFDDYIANGKENLYQSLHTTVIATLGHPLEVQIRTYDMHRTAEYGVAAHWRYKEGVRPTKDMHFEEKMTWLRQLVEWQRVVAGAEEFLESVKTDIFRDQVFVYTPKGEVKELPAGSTPIDFAYRIHTDLGHRCIGGKVNGKLVPLGYRLKNGDTVEILASKVARGPSLDWLNPNLGYVTTANALEKIRQWFNRRQRSENIQRGRDILPKELRRLGLDLPDEELVRALKFDSLDDLFAAVGSGALAVHQISTRLTSQPGLSSPIVSPSPATNVSPGIQVLGVGDLLTRIARCCGPLPGDRILGFVTRTSGVSVHRADCRNIVNEDEKERIVRVDWGPNIQLYPVPIAIEAWDRVGLLQDITTLVAEEKVNISSVNTKENPDGTATISLTLHISGVNQLTRLMGKLESVRGLVSVTRSPQA